MRIYRIISVFVISLLLLSGVSVLLVAKDGRGTTSRIETKNQSNTDSLTYTLEPGSLTIDQKDSYRSLSYSGFENGVSPNAPSVPVEHYSFLLPKGADQDSVEVNIKSNIKKKLDDTYHFEPMKKPATDGSMIQKREKDVSIYKSDSYYPERILKNIEVHKIRTASVISFDYFPLKWNPISGKVILREDVSVSIQYNEKSDSISDPLTYDMITDQKNDFDNYEDVSSTYHYNSDSGSVTYAIVTTNSIVSNSNKLDDFEQYLSGKGYNVKVITEGEYGTNTGQQRAIDIRNYLSDNYVSENIKYALMVGDPDPDDVELSSDSYGEVPMMMCYPRKSYSKYRESPTDYFYADLTGDWDLDGDGFYGEYDEDSGTGGVDFNAEIHVGRIPVYNDDYGSLDAIFSNIVNYQSKGGNWKKRMMLPMAVSNYENENDEGYSRTDGLDLPEYMYNNILSPVGFTDEVMYERSGLNPVSTSAFHYSQPITESNFIDEFNNGYGSVFWWGHGNRSSASRKYWASDDDSDGVPDSGEMGWKDFMSSSSVSQLETDQPSFFYQSSCLNGYPEVSYNLGYSLLQSGAAVSTVTASRVSWYAVGTWSPNKELADNSGLGYYYMKSLLVDEKPAGEALSYAKSYTGEYLEDASWMNKFDFNLYGDPSQGYYTGNAEPTVDAGEDKNVDEDTIVTFNGSGSTDDSGIVNYTWTIDGTYKYGEEVHHTFKDPGTYEITLKVTDEVGAWDTDTVNITVLDVTDPVADAGSDRTVEKGSEVTFDGSGSTDNVGIVNYTWSRDNIYRYGVEVQFTFNDGGNFQIVLNVTDDAGNYDKDTCTVTVEGDTEEPVADAGSDKTVSIDELFTLNGSSSTDNIGMINYTWTGDNNTYYREEITLSFSETKKYIFTLNVTDAAGNYDTDIVNITVLDMTDPTADAGEDKTFEEDTLVTFDGSASSDNVGIVNYTWTIEGVEYYGKYVNRIFTQPGKYTVELNVSDSAGNYDMDKKNITVMDTTSPLAEAGEDQTVALGEDFVLNGSGSSDNVEMINYTWSNDDDLYYGVEVTHSFSEVGRYRFILNVTDDAGNWATDTVNIYVEDQTKPTADAGPDKTYAINETFTLDGSRSTDNVGVVNYRWFHDGKEWVGKETTYSFLEKGTYRFILNVTDEAGNHDTDTVNITIEDRTSPIADAGDDKTVAIEEVFILTAMDSYDNVGIVNYTWISESGTYYGVDIPLPFSEVGVYSFILNVTDAAGNYDTDTLNVTVEDRTSPVADAGENRTVDEDEPILLQGMGSTDNVGIVEYTWTIKDEEYNGEGITNVFKDPGTYRVILNVTDEAGNFDTDTMKITVKDTTEPITSISFDELVEEDTAATFDASNSYDNVGIFGYEWVIENKTVNGEVVSHTFKDPGEYELKLTISDEAGNHNTTILKVTVKDVTKPIAEAGKDITVGLDEGFSLDGNKSTDNVGIVEYKWVIKSDSYSTASVKYSFDEIGVYEARLIVKDEAGNRDTDIVNISVEDRTNPEASFEFDGDLSVGSEVDLDGSDSSDNVGIDTYKWNLGDGTTLTGKNVTHTYETAGNYTISLTVTDENGNTDTYQDTIKVEKSDEDTPGFTLFILFLILSLTAISRYRRR